ncbi:MAG: transposase [Candidatus Levybacteria bacterium]|nr:transposase [Candidatus Levybacteria bacterium]
MSFIRRTPLVNGGFYHIFNRGVARAPTFLSRAEYKQAMLTLSYYRYAKPPVSLARFKEFSQEERQQLLNSLQKTEKLVEIVAFVLMPNHFHFLLKQNKDNGISKFVSQFTNSYTRYFNTLNERVGPLFQGVFKSVYIEADEQLIHVSRYIHLNPVVSNVIREEDLLAYPWSSLPDYLGSGVSAQIFTDPVLSHFKSPQEYRRFIFDQIGYGKELERIKHLVVDD